MRKPTFVSILVWINGAVPAVLLLNDALHHRLGANPVHFALLTTGLLSIIFLMLSLSITPLREITRWNTPFPARRTFGLWAAIYAFTHFGIFFWWERERSVSGTVHEILTRDYLWFGTAALLIFIPLTLTSTQGMIQRLGPKAWKWLHRLVYVAAIGAAIHYLKQGKFATTQAITFASIIGTLLAYRVVALFLPKRRPKRGPKMWRGQLKVIETRDETHEVRTFRLGPVDGDTLPFTYKAGQYLNVMLRVDGKPVNRSYTIASTPTRPGYCELSVKREEMGVSSRHLHHTIKVGDQIDVSAPAGRFTFDEKKHDSLVLIAGGVGITPLMSKVRYLTDIDWRGDIDFILSARTERDIIFRDELTKLAIAHPNLHVTITLSRADDSWTGARGRVSPHLLRHVVPYIENRQVHLCGPTEMTDATTEMLISLGVPEEQIESESFTPAGRMAGESAAGSTGSAQTLSAPALGDDEPRTLTFESSATFAEVAADVTILEAAEDAGVEIEFDCRSGICGTCKKRLISGDVVMDVEDALTASDREARIILTCQARCLNNVTIDA